jgi:Glycosyl transferases group 1
MKIVFYNTSGTGHHKNYDAIQRMCCVCNIAFEATNDFERCKRADYDILISNDKYFNPDLIPNVKIIYGPQLFVIPSGDIIGSINAENSHRTAINSLAPWNTICFNEFAGSLVHPIVNFPFAVDTNKFAPTTVTKDLDFLVYIKDRHHSVINYALNTLNRLGIKYEIIRYGLYNEDQYKHLLSRAKCMLSVGRHESQGFALQEAMACGVPLLVWDVKSMHEEAPNGYTFIYARYHPKKMLATCVPWWSDECGIKFYEETELEAGLKKMLETWETFTPRDYIVRELSEKPCVNRIMRYFGYPEIE